MELTGKTMRHNRRTTNIILLTLVIAMSVTVALLAYMPHVVSSFSQPESDADSEINVSHESMDTASLSSDLMHVKMKVEEKQPHTSAKLHQETPSASKLPESDLSLMQGSHPFAAEAKKTLSGNLQENDSIRRRIILNYCEHFRTAYTTKDLDFLRQTFSDNALIIVGNVVKTDKNSGTSGTSRKVTYALKSKARYLERLAEVFRTNNNIDVRFSGFHILRHPTKDGIYGVTLRQRYESDRYSDDGYLFLLWDFQNPVMPMIHVRTWQPAESVGEEDDIIDISDFNLE